MAMEKRYSRLDLAYLGKRHAGMVFMLLALGLLAGIAWRSLVQATRYQAEAEAPVTVLPAEAAGQINWEDKRIEWENVLRDRREWGLLNVNLRHAVKLAVTQNMKLDGSQLAARLAMLEPQETVSASLFANPVVARFGLTMDVTRRDIAANMDFQSLAVVIADMDPSREVQEGWDFTFFASFLPDRPEADIIAVPGADDPYFKVFYKLYSLLHQGREPASPTIAWGSAVDELAARLEREAQFAGGGGFGPHAKRELLREIVAVPSLAANCLYHANGWLGGENRSKDWTTVWDNRWSKNTVISLKQKGAAAGSVTVGMEMELKPLAFPRDTVVTRLPPLAVSTVISFLATREEALAKRVPVQPAAPVAAAVPLAAPAVVETSVAEPAQVQEQAAYREVIDDVADKQRLAHIAMLEESVRMAVRDKDACARRLNAAREDENRFSYEAVNARTRADRLQERHEQAVAQAAPDHQPQVPEETARLFAERDAKLRRLTELLAYCTEEHPFVKAVRRELASLEAELATHAPDPNQFRQAEARATRIANLYLEWESADAAADSLEERRRRQSESVACLLEEVVNIEGVISQRELELAAARRVPVPILRIEVAAEKQVAAIVPKTEEKVAHPEVAVPAVAPTKELAAILMVAGAPSRIALQRTPPGWGAVWWGICGGLALSALGILLRELFSRYIFSAAEARRMVQLPVLASLPAYDPKSLKVAAGTMKGELAATGRRSVQFVPSPVELYEPAAEARRGKIAPVKKFPRLVGWAMGLALLALAGMVYYSSLTGIAPPRVGFAGELPLPSATVPAWSEEREAPADWGDMP